MANDIDIIGYDKVINYLVDYPNANQIILKRGANQLYITPENINVLELAVVHFKSFVQTHILAEHNGNNFTVYKLQINNVNKNKKVTQLTNPNIQFNATPQSQHISKPMGNTEINGFNQKELIILVAEHMALKKENDDLKEERDELQNLLTEAEQQIETSAPVEKPKGIGDVMTSMLEKNAEPLMMMLVGKLFGNANMQNPIGMAGIETPESLFAQMLLIEPEFIDHLKLLINLRRHKPEIYNMAVINLQNMI